MQWILVFLFWAHGTELTILSHLPVSDFVVHPLKMSSARLESSPDGDMELVIRVFKDDLGDAISQLYSIENPDFSATNMNGTLHFEKYLLENLFIQQGDIKSTFSITNVANSDDNLCYEFTLKNQRRIPPDRTFTIQNTVLMDVFKKQINVLRYDGKDYYFNIRYPRQEVLVNPEGK